MFEIAVLTGRDRVFYPPCTRTNQDVPHQLIEPVSLHVPSPQLECPLLINYLLSVVFSNLPLSLHLFNLTFHVGFVLFPFLDLLHFAIEGFLELCYVSLSTVHICLINCLELQDLLFELYI